MTVIFVRWFCTQITDMIAIIISFLFLPYTNFKKILSFLQVRKHNGQNLLALKEVNLHNPVFGKDKKDRDSRVQNIVSELTIIKEQVGLQIHAQAGRTLARFMYSHSVAEGPPPTVTVFICSVQCCYFLPKCCQYYNNSSCTISRRAEVCYK